MLRVVERLFLFYRPGSGRLALYESPAHGRQCLEDFRHRYNTIRPHWALIPLHGGDPITPHDVYVDGRAMAIPKWQSWAKAAKEKLNQLMTQEAA